MTYFIAGVLGFLFVFTIPWGIASFRLANFALWPFGRKVVQKPGTGTLSFLGNVIWLFSGGAMIAFMHLVTGLLLMLSIVGIPLAAGNFKMIPISLAPLGKVIVRTNAPQQVLVAA